MSKKKEIDLHIAVFGDTNAGKTLLLSAFFDYCNSQDFKDANKYKLIIQDDSKRTKLINTFNKLADNQFPEPSKKAFEKFEFEIRVDLRNQDEKIGHIFWYDYPGEWWNITPSTEIEKKKRDKAFKQLMNCDVAFLLVDGARFKIETEKERYLNALFKQIRGALEVQRINKNGEKENSKNRFPSINKQEENRFPNTWVLALTKVDLLNDFEVKFFRNQVNNCKKSLDELKTELTKWQFQPKNKKNIPEDNISLGDYYLLLSSAEIDEVRDEKNRIINKTVKNRQAHIGLDLIAPVALKAPFENAKRLAKRDFSWIFPILRVGHYLSHRYCVLLEMTGFREIISLSLEKLEKKKEQAIKRKELAEYIIILFCEKLENAKRAKTYLDELN